MWLVIISTPGLPPPASTSLVPAAKEQQIPVIATEYQHRVKVAIRLGISCIPEPRDCCITQCYIIHHTMSSYIVNVHTPGKENATWQRGSSSHTKLHNVCVTVLCIAHYVAIFIVMSSYFYHIPLTYVGHYM